MEFGQLRLAGIVAIFVGVLVGAFLGWATPIFLNPFVKPDMVGGIFFLALFLVITPLIGYFEMVFSGSDRDSGRSSRNSAKARRSGWALSRQHRSAWQSGWGWDGGCLASGNRRTRGNMRLSFLILG